MKDLVQVHRVRFHHLFPAENEELAGQMRSPLGGLADLFEVRLLLPLESGIGQQQVGVALHDAENVVEVVGESGGQSAQWSSVLPVNVLRSPNNRFLCCVFSEGGGKEGVRGFVRGLRRHAVQR